VSDLACDPAQTWGGLVRHKLHADYLIDHLKSPNGGEWILDMAWPSQQLSAIIGLMNVVGHTRRGQPQLPGWPTLPAFGRPGGSNRFDLWRIGLFPCTPPLRSNRQPERFLTLSHSSGVRWRLHDERTRACTRLRIRRSAHRAALSINAILRHESACTKNCDHLGRISGTTWKIRILSKWLRVLGAHAETGPPDRRFRRPLCSRR